MLLTHVTLYFPLKYISAHFRRITPSLKSFRVNRMIDFRKGSKMTEIRNPQFAHLSETKIKANVGSTITFNCRVRNTDNYTVRKFNGLNVNVYKSRFLIPDKI